MQLSQQARLTNIIRAAILEAESKGYRNIEWDMTVLVDDTVDKIVEICNAEN